MIITKTAVAQSMGHPFSQVGIAPLACTVESPRLGSNENEDLASRLNLDQCVLNNLSKAVTLGCASRLPDGGAVGVPEQPLKVPGRRGKGSDTIYVIARSFCIATRTVRQWLTSLSCYECTDIESNNAPACCVLSGRRRVMVQEA